MTFVLVHGGWHGGWCWERLEPLLREAGHEVVSPTLPGLGDRSAEASPDIGLTAHIAAVADEIRERDLSDVHLVGHSYGGIVITGVADQLPGIVRQLTYLDAIVPQHGKSLVDLLKRDGASMRRAARRAGDGWLVPPPVNMDRWPGIDGLFGVTDEPDLTWVRGQLTPHPLRTFEEPLVLAMPAQVDAIPKTYIHCTEGGWLFQLSRRFKPAYRPPQDPRWNQARLPTGHDAMITAPRELADLLLQLALAD